MRRNGWRARSEELLGCIRIRFKSHIFPMKNYYEFGIKKSKKRESGKASIELVAKVHTFVRYVAASENVARIKWYIIIIVDNSL